MKIRFFSFDFDVSRHISKEDFITYLLSCDEGDFDFGGKKRIFYLKNIEKLDCYLGLLVTIKNHKKYTTLKAKKIKVTDVGRGQDLIELNYFIVHKKSARVLYQHYHQSCSVTQFILFLNIHHNAMAEGWVESELKKQEHLPPKKQKTKQQLKREFGKLLHYVTMKEDSLSKLLEDLSHISTFEYPMQVLEVQGKKTAQPLSGYVQRSKHKITFRRDKSFSQIRQSLLGYIKNNKILEGKIKGRDNQEVPRVIDLCENAAHHAEYEFDDLISQLDDGEVTDLENNYIIKELLNVSKTIKLSVIEKLQS